MGNEKEARPILAPVILAAFHGILWIVLLGIMWTLVPNVEKILVEFEADVPTMTVWALTWSHISVCYWFLILPFIAALCTADLIVLYTLYLHPKAAVLRWLWLALMLLVPLGLMASTVLAMFLPLISPIEDLS